MGYTFINHPTFVNIPASRPLLSTLASLSTMPPELSPQVLRNLGIPVKLCEVGPDPVSGRLTPLMGDDGPILKPARIKFDANALAELEDRYGSLDAYEEVTSTKAFVGVRGALAILFNLRREDGSWDDEKAGAMVPDGEAPRIGTAIMSALALANGVDPTQVARMYQIGLKQQAEGMKAAGETLAERLEFAEHPERFKEVEKDGEWVLERVPSSSPEEATSATASAPGTSATTPTDSPSPAGSPASPTTSSTPPPASSPSTEGTTSEARHEPSPHSEPPDQTPEQAELPTPTPEQVESRPFTIVKAG